MSHDSFNADNMNNNQCVISHELLALLQWILEHDVEKLKKLVDRAVTAGLPAAIQRHKALGDAHIVEDIQYSIVEFFGVLEALLYESMQEKVVQNVVEKRLMPALDHIDAAHCDSETIRYSVEKTSHRLSKNPQENPQEILFKELLRSWKPGNKKVTH